MIAYDRLSQIVPADQALAAKAFSVSLQQISSIASMQLPDLASAVTPLETTQDLPLISTLTQAVPASVASYFTTTAATGTGPNGTVLLVDIIGTAAGYVSAGSMANTVSNLIMIDTVALTSTYATMANVVNGVYGDPDLGPVVIPVGPYANTYADAEDAFGNALIPGAQSQIATIVSSYPSPVANLNANWNSMAVQLNLETSQQAAADIVFANLVPNSTATMYGFIFNLPELGQQTAVGGSAQLVESVANTATFTGQAVIVCMREGRNQPLLQSVGINTNADIPGEPDPPAPVANLIPSTYTAQQAANIVVL